MADTGKNACDNKFDFSLHDELVFSFYVAKILLFIEIEATFLAFLQV